MSVGFIGAGQLAHALVKGFTAAGERPPQTQTLVSRLIGLFYHFICSLHSVLLHAATS